ncbi:NAD-dependent epimerase/dehydratase family protein [Streptomyces sp. NPDC004682]
MKRAVVIGAHGQIGRPVVDALVRDGWEVTAATRSGGRSAAWDEGVRAVPLDRADDAALGAVVGDGCDVVVDLVGYNAVHARQLTALADRIGSAVVMSTVAVYADDAGRGFDTMDDPDGCPDFPVPIPETQPTVRPGDATYATRKSALEHELLTNEAGLPVTVLRPGAVHGPHSRLPRELYFVKRNVDGRPSRVLALRGETRFHTASARNVAELVRLAAGRPGTRALNACDPQAPTTEEIGTAIDTVMGVKTGTTLLDGPPLEGSVGLNPWAGPRPVVCDMSAAERELGYRPVVSYEDSLPETVEWLTAELRAGTWDERFPLLAGAYPELFNYAAEDALLAAREA